MLAGRFSSDLPGSRSKSGRKYRSLYGAAAVGSPEPSTPNFELPRDRHPLNRMNWLLGYLPYMCSSRLFVFSQIQIRTRFTFSYFCPFLPNDPVNKARNVSRPVVVRSPKLQPLVVDFGRETAEYPTQSSIGGTFMF